MTGAVKDVVVDGLTGRQSDDTVRDDYPGAFLTGTIRAGKVANGYELLEERRAPRLSHLRR